MSDSRITRRRFTQGLAAAGGVLLISRRAPAADFHMRQYHNQPVEAPLHKRLTQMWEAVKTETQGRVQVEIFPENNHFKDGDPDPLNLLLDGKLEFYTTRRQRPGRARARGQCAGHALRIHATTRRCTRPWTAISETTSARN